MGNLNLLVKKELFNNVLSGDQTRYYLPIDIVNIAKLLTYCDKKRSKKEWAQIIRELSNHLGTSSFAETITVAYAKGFVRFTYQTMTLSAGLRDFSPKASFNIGLLKCSTGLKYWVETQEPMFSISILSLIDKDFC